jgi:hypothetical protein
MELSALFVRLGIAVSSAVSVPRMITSDRH